MEFEFAEPHLEDVPPELQSEWDQERRAAEEAAREACAALRRREPRIALLFERYSRLRQAPTETHRPAAPLPRFLGSNEDPPRELRKA
jgi:hypothetical protein